MRRAIALVMTLLPQPRTTSAWSSAHTMITRCALDIQPLQLQQLWHASSIFAPMGHASYRISTFMTDEGAQVSKAGGNWAVWAEAGDTIDGPCPSKPCAANFAAAKLELRNFAYGENASGHGPWQPWPYDIPACAPGVSTGCLPGPVQNTWTFHYFDFDAPENLRRATAGAGWVLANAAAAFRAGNADQAALYLTVMAHGIEDRSSPYHAWGGNRTSQAAADTLYNISATCSKLCPSPASCGGNTCRPDLHCLLFWALDDGGPDRIGSRSPKSSTNMYCPANRGQAYTPRVLGQSVASAAVAIGQRMEQQALDAQAIMLRPRTGYIASHLRDNWTFGLSSPATDAVIGEMGLLSSKLAADVWVTAWSLSRQYENSVADGGECFTALLAMGDTYCNSVTRPQSDSIIKPAAAELRRVGCTDADVASFCSVPRRVSSARRGTAAGAYIYSQAAADSAALADMALDRAMVRAVNTATHRIAETTLLANAQ